MQSCRISSLAAFALSSVVLLSAGAAPIIAPIEHSLSSSRQFIVYGANAQLRGAIADTAEQTKANALTILRQADNWKTPIVINLQFPQANIPDVPSAALYFSQTGAGLKLQLDLVIDASMQTPRIQREILRAILLERIYRKQPDLPPGTAYVQPPDWLLDGLLAASPGEDRRALAGAVSSLASADKPASLEAFLRQRPDLIDSPARLLYRAGSLALLQLFLDTGLAGPRLGVYIDHLADSPNDPVAAVQLQFPDMKPADLDKSWQAKLRNLDTILKFDLLTFAESERRLAEMLRLRIRTGSTEKVYELADFPGVKKLSSSQKKALVLAGENLALLGTVSNPLMRPIVGEYQKIAQLLALGKRSGLSARLKRVKSIRERLITRMNDVDDYLNWFEATQLETNSGLFGEFLKTAAGRDAEAPRRRDAISVYLDSLEHQTGN